MRKRVGGERGQITVSGRGQTKLRFLEVGTDNTEKNEPMAPAGNDTQ